MQTDFLSHPLLRDLAPAAGLAMTHRDVAARADPAVAITASGADGGGWRVLADHSYHSGRATEFSFEATDPAAVCAAIEAAVQAAVIDHQGRMLSMLATINAEVINSLDGTEIVRNVLGEVRHVLGACDSGVLRLLDEKSGYLEPVAREGLPEDYRQYRLLPGESISGEVFSTQRPALVNGRGAIIAAHRVMRPESQSFMDRSEIANALMCVPVVTEGRCLGTLTTLSFSPGGRFAPFDLAILKALAAQIAIGYRRSQSYQEALATARRLEEARQALTRKNRDLDRAVSLHETLLRIFAAETGLAAQLDAVAELYRAAFRFESVLGHAHRSGGWSDADEEGALVQTVEAAGLAVGRFLVRSEGDAGVLRSLFGTVAAFTALEFMRNLSQLDLLNARKSDWFDALAASGERPRPQFGFSPERHVQVIAAALPGDRSMLGPYRVLSGLQAALPARNALAFHRDDRLVLALSAPTMAALERNLAAAARAAAEMDLQMGASAARDDWATLGEALDAASQAAAAQARRGRAGLLRHGDMGIEQLFAGRSRREILAFSRQVIAPLAEPKHRQLHETLQRYVAEGKSASRTAQALNIHPNTLYQRLQRIETLLRRSLSDPADYTLLSLACQLEADYAAPPTED
ncbi:helix-turn-helix domain-containing protein [Poseidonocella sp. HB161398]|uniref:helix-turn-helix domain-containing protein n=1 Tax=Poseidonocella sp. HB161398 TaxID=2320855 RepID=UPI001109E87C|nr:helix-turn-helix domain-containing protein [Poseidonocella sp. HB161398]